MLEKDIMPVSYTHLDVYKRQSLDTMVGTRSADVVFYDPDVDIAVLYSPDLGLDALPWAQTPLETGDDAIDVYKRQGLTHGYHF